MTRSLNRLTLVFILCFAVVALSLGYWGVVASDSMLARPDNPRRVEDELAIWRGAIYDRNGQALAQTVVSGLSPSGKEVLRRDYPHPEAATAIGYYSLVHGVGGVEAAYDTVLRGDDRRNAGSDALASLLHTAQVGSDVRLTIDARLQIAISSALKGRRGAVVLIDVPSGATLAMVSAPTFDPNKLNAIYDELLKDPSAPLLNRVTQGIYQPGGALQTVILAAMLSGDSSLSLTTPVIGATRSITVAGLMLNCASTSDPLTLQAAYGLACPAPFADAIIGQPGPDAMQKTFDAFGLLHPPKLISFVTVSGSPMTPLTTITDSVKLRAQAVGQGDLTVTPLQMALVASTIANHGNAITPYLVDATRLPGAATWQPVLPTEGQTAVLTEGTTALIRTAMRAAVTDGAAKAADHPDTSAKIYGHASIAYTGPQKNADSWFIGFADLPDGRSVATAVVIEDTGDPAVAAGIGGLALSQVAQ